MNTTASKAAKKRGRIAPIANREELAAIAMATAAIVLEKDKAIIQRDQRLADIADSWNPSIDELERKIDANVQRLKLYCTAHRAEEFGDKQSITICGHELAFRKGTGAVGYDAGVKEGDALESLLGYEDPATWPALAEKIGVTPEHMAAWIRDRAEAFAENAIDDFSKVKVTLDKNAILKVFRSGSKESRALLESLGIRLVTKEEFHFTPAREEIAPASIGGGSADGKEAA